MRGFLRKTSLERDPLPVTMTGVRLGERVLQIGVADVKLTSRLAAKPGMSGRSAIVVGDERTAERARSAAAEVGALVDVHVNALAELPFEGDSFDVVIVHGASDLLAPLDRGARAQMMRECHRVLRAGGRLVSLEPGTATGLTALLRRGRPADEQYEASGGTSAALEAGGFAAVRLLADREGYRFIEGLKT